MQDQVSRALALCGIKLSIYRAGLDEILGAGEIVERLMRREHPL